jgi:hypothetical protein
VPASTRRHEARDDECVQAYGSDRVRLREDGAALLSCRLAKPNWQARAPKTLTTSEHPGTAVLWDDGCWEVVQVEVLPQLVRYTLAPWPESHTMRLTDRYDEVTEAEREAEHRRKIARERGRQAANLLAFITGHLPATVQEHLGSETGINPPRLTQISTIPPFVAFAALILFVAGRIIEQKPLGVPPWLGAVLLYMFVDSIVRFLFTFAQQRPIGSLPGLIGYGIFYALSPHRSRLAAPLAAPQGTSTRATPLSEEATLQSAVTLREPLFSLLAVDDQLRVAERYGVDYRKTAPTIAWIILISACFGAVSSARSISAAHPTTAISLLAAAGLIGEQTWRLIAFNRGPAPSVLRFAVRWMVRRYLD